MQISVKLAEKLGIGGNITNIKKIYFGPSTF